MFNPINYLRACVWLESKTRSSTSTVAVTVAAALGADVPQVPIVCHALHYRSYKHIMPKRGSGLPHIILDSNTTGLQTFAKRIRRRIATTLYYVVDRLLERLDGLYGFIFMIPFLLISVPGVSTYTHFMMDFSNIEYLKFVNICCNQ